MGNGAEKAERIEFEVDRAAQDRWTRKTEPKTPAGQVMLTLVCIGAMVTGVAWALCGDPLTYFLLEWAFPPIRWGGSADAVLFLVYIAGLTTLLVGSVGLLARMGRSQLLYIKEKTYIEDGILWHEYHWGPDPDESSWTVDAALLEQCSACYSEKYKTLTIEGNVRTHHYSSPDEPRVPFREMQLSEMEIWPYYKTDLVAEVRARVAWTD